MRLPAALRGIRGAVLDTMVLIYLLEDHPKFGALCEWLLQRAEAGDYSAVVTPVTMAELLVKPLQAGRSDLSDRYQAAIRNAPNVRLCDVTWRTGAMAGALRAKYGLALPDMFQAASAMEHGGVLVTNDRTLRKVGEIRVVLLEDLSAHAGRGA